MEGGANRTNVKLKVFFSFSSNYGEFKTKQWNALPVTMKHVTRRLIEIGMDGKDSSTLVVVKPFNISHN